MTFTHFLNVLNALQRLARYTNVGEEAASDMAEDFSVLRRAKISRGDLAALQVRSEASSRMLPRAPRALEKGSTHTMRPLKK